MLLTFADAYIRIISQVKVARERERKRETKRERTFRFLSLSFREAEPTSIFWLSPPPSLLLSLSPLLLSMFVFISTETRCPRWLCRPLLIIILEGERNCFLWHTLSVPIFRTLKKGRVWRWVSWRQVHGRWGGSTKPKKEKCRWGKKVTDASWNCRTIYKQNLFNLPLGKIPIFLNSKYIRVADNPFKDRKVIRE